MYFPSRDLVVNASNQSLMQYPAGGNDSGFSVNAYSGGTGASLNSYQESVTSSNVQIPLLEGIIGNDAQTRNRLYKDMYFHDPISGGAVDVLSSFLGDFHLTGIQDQSRMDKFAATAAAISPSTSFPMMTREYLVMGKFIGTKIFDKRKGYITGISPHGADTVEVQHVPVHGHDPICDLKVEDSFQQMMNSDDPRVKEVLTGLPKFYSGRLQEGGLLPLQPQNTIYFPRQTLASVQEGVSLFEPTLAVWMIEKNLYRGTIDASTRRQRSILHAMVGEDQDIVIDNKHIQAVTNAIKQADMDPQGAVLTTRDNISISQFMEPQGFWSVDQITGWAAEMKYYAYRISPEMINGTASMSTLDASLSIMLNNLKQYRSLFEEKIIQQGIFADVAIANGFKRKEGHRNGALAMDKRYGRQTFNLADYDLPHVVWKQGLSPEGDSAYLDMLHQISDLGVPVTLSMFAAAAGLNLEDLLAGSKKDVTDRREAAKYWKEIERNSSAMVQQEIQQEFSMKMQKAQAEQQAAEQAASQQGQGPQGQQGGQDVNAALANMAALASHGRNDLHQKRGWDEREWDFDKQGFSNSDNMGRYRTGTTEGRNLRKERTLKLIAERLEHYGRKQAHEAKEAEWRRNHS